MKRKMMKKEGVPWYILVFIHRREVMWIISIRRTASWTESIQVLLDVVPAVATDLPGGMEVRYMKSVG